ncbi:MAG: class I SAM-dependent methyltransferase [Henriciella sp.]
MDSSYTQDVEFNSAFGVLQTPVHMLTACLVAGKPAPGIERPFRFLDLACGNGLTLALLADAYPHAEFVGVDINPAHIEDAKERASAAGISNLTFFEGDLLSLKANSFGPVDYAAVGGIYSWLDTERRRATRQFLGSVLAPGGVVYIDYSAQPGMAQNAALYNLLQRFAANIEGSSAEKLVGAARMADDARKKGARFFAINQHAHGRLEAILKNRPEDEAHEVLNLQGHGFWSADVIEEMHESGLEFTADIGLHHNVPSLSGFPQRHAGQSVATHQTLFDLHRNVPHRRELYTRGTSDAPFDLLHELESLPLFYVRASLSAEKREDLNKRFKASELSGHDAEHFVEAVLGSDEFLELFGALRQEGWTDDKIARFVRIYLALRMISVAIARTGPQNPSGKLVMTSSLNRRILTEDIGERHVRPFSSPVVGTRVLLPMKDRLYLWSLLGLDLRDAWDRLDDLRSSFVDNRNQPVDRESFVQIIEQSLPAFRRVVAPELLKLRILSTVEENET